MMILRFFSGLSPVSSSSCWMDEATGSGAGARGEARTDREGAAAMSGGGRQQHEQYMEQGGQRIRNTNQGLHLLVHPIPPMFPMWYQHFGLSKLNYLLSCRIGADVSFVLVIFLSEKMYFVVLATQWCLMAFLFSQLCSLLFLQQFS